VYTAKPVARGLRRRVGHCLLRTAGGSTGFAGAHCLNWRTRHVSIRAEHTTVSRLRLQLCSASGANIEKLASIGWHRFLLCRLAVRTSDR
jgi:hypothetical protein